MVPPIMKYRAIVTIPEKQYICDARSTKSPVSSASMFPLCHGDIENWTRSKSPESRSLDKLQASQFYCIIGNIYT